MRKRRPQAAFPQASGPIQDQAPFARFTGYTTGGGAAPRFVACELIGVAFCCGRWCATSPRRGYSTRRTRSARWSSSAARAGASSTSAPCPPAGQSLRGVRVAGPQRRRAGERHRLACLPLHARQRSEGTALARARPGQREQLARPGRPGRAAERLHRPAGLDPGCDRESGA